MHPAKKALGDYLDNDKEKLVAYDENPSDAQTGSVAETMKGLFPTTRQDDEEEKKRITG